MNFNFKKRYTISDMLKIMEILRSENGCPWDKVQTHHSIRNDFIEETYEAIEAIDTDNYVLMREELGDVLFQIIFHCEIEKENSRFTFDDIVSDLAHKMIERHPHVFGNVNAETCEEVLTNWDNIKNNSKNRNTGTKILKEVSPALPALMRAQKVQSKAEKLGFSEENIKEIPLNKQEAKEYLFSTVRKIRKSGFSAEEILSEAIEEYILRFDKKQENDV